MKALTLRLRVVALLVTTLFFTACEDPAEDVNLADPSGIRAGTIGGGGLTVISGFQGVAFERLNDGSIGPEIAGVKITFTREDGSGSYTVYTGSAGNYKVTLTPARYHVVATHPDHEIYNSAPGFFVVNGTGYQTGNFFLEKLNYGFQGFTYQRNWDGTIGPKLSYVKLTFTKDDGLFTKTLYSSSGGHYKVSLPKGKYFLKAEKSGYYTYDSTPGVGVVTGASYQTLNFFQKVRLILQPI